MSKKRVFLTGNDRAEFEHIFGPLDVDPVDPRFVLVSDEVEEKIRLLPAGVPSNRGDAWPAVQKIRAAEAEAGGFDLDLEPSDDEGPDISDEATPVSKGEGKDKAVAETGTPVHPGPPAAADQVKAKPSKSKS